VPKPRQHLLTKNWSLVAPNRREGKTEDQKFSIGGQGEAPQSYGPQARVLNNLNGVGV
jgi:hypothetical protein